MNPQKDAQTTFRGGVRSVVGCGVSATKRARSASGARRRARSWPGACLMLGRRSRSFALEIDVKARNARIARRTGGLRAFELRPRRWMPASSRRPTIILSVFDRRDGLFGPVIGCATEPGDAHAAAIRRYRRRRRRPRRRRRSARPRRAAYVESIAPALQRTRREPPYPDAPSCDSPAAARCAHGTLRPTSSVGMTWPRGRRLQLCVTLGFSLQMRKRASDLCWSAMM